MTLLAYKLEEAGFKRNQIEAMSEFFNAMTASKTDLLEMKMDLKGEIVALRTDLKGEIATLRTEFAADIVALRTKLDADIAALRNDITHIRGTARQQFWMNGVLLTIVLMIAGKLLLL